MHLAVAPGALSELGLHRRGDIMASNLDQELMRSLVQSQNVVLVSTTATLQFSVVFVTLGTVLGGAALEGHFPL